MKTGLSGTPAGSKRAKADLPEIIADNIRMQIVKGDLTTGSKLPTEQELCNYHEVSRVVVREAVARLRHEGLLVSQQGKGVFVASLENARFLSISDGYRTKPDDFRKLYELRNILESGTSALAALHHDADDMTLLESTLEHMSNGDIDPDDYVAADMAFHRAIAAASKNAFLVLFISFVDSKLKEAISISLSRLDFEKTVSISADEHSVILECIKFRDSEGARLGMQTHLGNSAKRLGI